MEIPGGRVNYVRRVRRGGGALGARAPPHLKKSSAQKCPKEERKFRPDKLAKRMCTFRSDTTKLKRKRQGKKKISVKEKG